MVIHGFISSLLDYCNSLFIYLKTYLNWLQTVQNAAARLLTKANRHLPPLLVDLIQTYSASRSLRSSGQKWSSLSVYPWRSHFPGCSA
ncbi:hypothetical protein LDENG_00228800 [Lucifuga dentata]|nr:hypothetical protein LDENG_00228800 [Lucifuga dentata]